MKRLFALFLLSLTAHVFAQVTVDNPCGFPPPVLTVYYQDRSPPPGSSAYACLPAPGGSGTGFAVRSNLKGATASWYCPEIATPGGPIVRWHPTWAAATWARVAVGDLRIDTPMADPQLTEVWCPHIKEIYANVPVVVPVATTKYTAAGSLAIYVTSAGKLARVVVGRKATLGAVCDASVLAIVSGAATYYPLLGGPANEVTYCKVTP